NDPLFPQGRDQTFSEDRITYAMTVTKGPPNILVQALPSAQYRATYTYVIDAAGGTTPYIFSDVSPPRAGHASQLPDGLSVSAAGVIGNFPIESNGPTPFPFSVKLLDADGNFDVQNLSVTVVVLPLIILTSNPIPQAAAEFPYTLQLKLAS